MEIDSNREIQAVDSPVKKPWLLRDAGVPTYQNGRWILVNWYESMSESIQLLTASSPLNEKHKESSRPNSSIIAVDLSGE